jgi:hypothetical protein
MNTLLRVIPRSWRWQARSGDGFGRHLECAFARLLDIMAWSDMKRFWQSNIDWNPAHFSGWPFCPPPSCNGALHPGAWATVRKSQFGAPSIDRGRRSAWTILVQTRKSEQHSRNSDLIDRRQRLPCRAVPSVHPLHLGKNKTAAAPFVFRLDIFSTRAALRLQTDPHLESLAVAREIPAGSQPVLF